MCLGLLKEVRSGLLWGWVAGIGPVRMEEEFVLGFVGCVDIYIYLITFIILINYPL